MNDISYKLQKASDFELDGKYLHAIQIYKSILFSHPEDEDSLIGYSLLLEKMGHPKALLNLCVAYGSYSDAKPLVLNAFASVLVKNNFYNEALELLDNPNLVEDAQSKFIKCYSLFNLEHFDDCLVILSGFCKDYPSSQLLPHAEILLAKIYIEKEDYQRALEAANRSEMLFTQNSEVHLVKAIIYNHKKMFLHAFECIKKSLKLNSREIIAVEWAAKISFRMQDYQSSENYLNKCISMGCTDSEIFSMFGVIKLFNENKIGAEKYFKKALELDPQNYMAVTGIKELNSFYIIHGVN
ncbi:MAG: hypothetical protein KJ799_05265 [Bacteroidetes bacterium]|nr:hypothetical protein [Bacteroidota bacterium]MBU1680965.1 hypothetical protein [Bacteroidota bacterium]MBU2506117.1 hypothetical protein [Bacteroidota bacterium]